MKENNVIYTDDFQTMDFSKLKMGDQIVLNKKNNLKNIEAIINDFNIYTVSKNVSNIISLISAKTEYLTYEDKYTEHYIDCKQKCEYLDLLLINNKTIKIRKTESYDPLLKSQLRHLLKKPNDMFCYKQFAKFINCLDFYFVCPISNQTYFVYTCKNEIKGYNWNISEDFYIYDNANNYIYSIKFKMDELLELLKTLKYDEQIENFKRIYKIIHYDVEDYLNDNSILNEIIEFYSDTFCFNKHDIEKFFKPIYETNNFKGYFSTKNSNNIRDNILYRVGSMDEKEITISKRITTTIKYNLLDGSIINLYTGEITDKDYKKVYEDSEHLIIRKYNYETHYFIKYNGIYIPANVDEREEIRELKRTIDILLNEN